MYFGPPVTGINDPVRKDYAWAVLYFRQDIKTTREYVLYTILSLAAEMGAFVGLLLGASLLDVGGWFNNFLDRCKQKKVSLLNCLEKHCTIVKKTKCLFSKNLFAASFQKIDVHPNVQFKSNNWEKGVREVASSFDT